MNPLQDFFKKAKEQKWAIGHFNFSTAEQLRAFVDVAAELKSPLMVGTSEGEAEFVGREQAVALVKSYQEAGHAVYLNSDHHKTWESASAAVDAGYDTIHIDASGLSFEENVELTKRIVEYAKSKNSSGSSGGGSDNGAGIMVEGELGYLRGSSEVQEKIEIKPEDFTKPEEAKKFVEATGVDRLAIVFGNIHGVTTKQKMHLDMDVLKSVIEVVSNIANETAPETYIVLHGGSGLPDEEIKSAIANGITNVHVNTELRVAYHDALESELAKDDESVTPYKFEKPAVEATKAKIKEKLQLFGSVDRI